MASNRTKLLLVLGAGLFAGAVYAASGRFSAKDIWKPPEYAYGGAGVKAYAGPENTGQQGMFAPELQGIHGNFRPMTG